MTVTVPATRGRLRPGLGAWLWVLLVLVAGCAEPAPVEKELGETRVSFVPPSGWRHFDHGRQQRFEREGASIVLSQLSPPVPPAQGGPSLGEWLEDTVEDLDPSAHRAIATRDTLGEEGQRVFRIDTWDRLTHEHRRRFAILSHGTVYLSVHLERGEIESVQQDFDRLVGSLQVLSTEEKGTGPAKEDDATAAGTGQDRSD